MINGCSNSIANWVDTLTLNGYSDWFLPSKDELNEIYQNLHIQGLGNFTVSVHHSSTKNNIIDHWIQNFDNGVQNGVNNQYSNAYIRAVRAF